MLIVFETNTCGVTCRIDCFMDISTSAFGEKLKEQVEERLRFYEEGIAPTKNSTAMHVSTQMSLWPHYHA